MLNYFIFSVLLIEKVDSMRTCPQFLLVQHQAFSNNRITMTKELYSQTMHAIIECSQISFELLRKDNSDRPLFTQQNRTISRSLLPDNLLHKSATTVEENRGNFSFPTASHQRQNHESKRIFFTDDLRLY